MIMMNCNGTRPENLGVREGKLLECPDKPNCVNSQAKKEDSHYIEPIKYKDDLKTQQTKLLKIISAESRTTLITKTENYLHVEFKSFLFRFIDDTEFYFDDLEKVIHVRSASRLGKSDLGVNRKRIEKIRSLLNE
jgi:uncharacterized protein (DUF1499 family)